MASYMAVAGNICGVVKGVHLDIYDAAESNHTTLVIPQTMHQKDNISDITISPDHKYIAVVTSSSKRLLIYSLPAINPPKIFLLQRSASKVRFTTDSNFILIADKTGDVFIYNISDENSKGVNILGHFSLLLDVLLTSDNKYIITCDRDEKIRVSCYPNTYDIQTYCLGHKEFVKQLEILPHNEKLLTSCSGDGTIKLWDYSNGKLYHNIDTSQDIDDKVLQNNFNESMDQEGVEVYTLPIVHFTIMALSNHSSIIAITVYNLNKVIIYSILEENYKFVHKLEDRIALETFPTAIQFNKINLYIFSQRDQTVLVYSLKKDNVTFELKQKINMFDGQTITNSLTDTDSIKVLFKRKFDNLQDYLERKRQRLENKSS